MGTWTYTTRFDAPPDRVFEALTDVPGYAQRISGIERVEMLTEGPVGVGTRFRETRVMMGKERAEEMAFTAYEPARRFVLACSSCGADMTFDHRLAPDAGGTRLDIEMTSVARTFGAKIMSPLAVLMKGAMRKALDKDYADIAAHLDSRTPETAGA